MVNWFNHGLGTQKIKRDACPMSRLALGGPESEQGMLDAWYYYWFLTCTKANGVECLQSPEHS